MNDSRIKVPRGAYRPETKPAAVKSGCRGENRDLFPKLKPLYAVGYGAEWCYLPSQFPAVHYRAWLPPFDRVVEVQRVPEGVK